MFNRTRYVNIFWDIMIITLIGVLLFGTGIILFMYSLLTIGTCITMPRSSIIKLIISSLLIASGIILLGYSGVDITGLQ